MRFLLSNDDGVFAEGLRAMREGLLKIGEVVVVAPDRDRSGASNSLTLDRPLRVHQLEPDIYRVDGTPTDCVHLALTGLLEQMPDMVISGINHGANLGDDVLYSGTVAAAMEGRILGRPSIAVSINSSDPDYLSTAVNYVTRLIELLNVRMLPGGMIFNVNVPDYPEQAIKGLRTTRLGYRHPAERVICDRDPRGRTIYWMGAAGNEKDSGPGTDFHALNAGYVSLTPLQTDLTSHKDLEGVSTWLTRMA